METAITARPRRPRPKVVTLTDAAAARVKEIMDRADQPYAGLRVGVKAGGCSGFEYVFAWEPAPRENDLIFEGADGARVWTDARSHRLLDGTTLDYDTSLLSRGFVFQNPQAKSTCGCGTSFSV